MDRTRQASRAILITWTCYALLWLGALTSTRWAPADAGLYVVSFFWVGIVVGALATALVTLRGLLAFRTPAAGSPWFRALVVASAAGAVGQLAYAFARWHG